MVFYEANLGVFAAANAYLLYRQYRGRSSAGGGYEKVDASSRDDVVREDVDDGHEDVESTAATATNHIEAPPGAVRQFQRDFFIVYALAVAADWLQGPHIYAIYKYEKSIPERTVAALYAAGFISGAASASFTGELADRYGRRLACLVYCACYAVTCLSMLSNSLPMLFLGRLTGGVATTLLFSVFEAWMVTEYHRRGLNASDLSLSTVFGRMTTLSCVVAIVAGVVGDVLVGTLGGRVWPFMAAVACALAAAYFIVKTWPENHGSSSTSSRTTLSDLKDGIATILSNKRILSLGLASCFFEGSMYLFIFFWSAALKSARARAGSTEELPFGLIFSSFMCSMMAGSAFFSLFTPRHTTQTTSFILTTAMLVVSCCFSLAVMIGSEPVLFWVLCLIEACIGAYFPSMSFLKSDVVDDGVRGRVYSILRFPLNVFVVVVHSLDQEGDGHRYNVFLSCAALLLASFFVVKRYFPEYS